jgi:hypothetical protein
MDLKALKSLLSKPITKMSPYGDSDLIPLASFRADKVPAGWRVQGHLGITGKDRTLESFLEVFGPGMTDPHMEYKLVEAESIGLEHIDENGSVWSVRNTDHSVYRVVMVALGRVRNG